MPEANAIWVCEPPNERSLSRRLRSFGLVSRRLRDPKAIEDALATSRPAGVIVSTRLGATIGPVMQALVPLLDDEHTTILAGGPYPSDTMRDELRNAGITLACFEPIDDAALRFQVNRCFVVAAEPPSAKARSALRAPLGWPVQVQIGARRKEGSLYDLSNGGAFIETERPSLSGARVELLLPLGDGSVAVPGEVVHTNVPGNLRKARAPIGMGIRFDPVSDGTETAIRRAVHLRCAELLV